MTAYIAAGSPFPDTAPRYSPMVPSGNSKYKIVQEISTDRSHWLKFMRYFNRPGVQRIGRKY
ncbi:MAG TPA: hypothetical protein VGG58_04990 [Candidatus Acidoferrum sp.]